MDIVFEVVGNVHVDDQLNGRHVQPARRNARGDENVRGAVPKLVQHVLDVVLLGQQLVPACALSIEIPVGVVGDVDGRERIARRSVFDRELIFIRELVNGVDLQISRVALFSVRTLSLQMNSARCHLFSFPHFNVERIFNSSVQVVVASVGM